ncbi:MAG TPA: hypothetical protein PLW02_00065 [Verrucomicrobiota bacterium]|nr:hypothetical protein [Verrucomicrobiota bacterium]
MDTINPEKISLIFALKEEAKFFKPLPHLKVYFSGIGKNNAEKFIKQILANDKPEIVLTCGFAGALNPALKFNTIVYSATDELKPILNSYGAVESKFYCSDRLIYSASKKLKLYQTTNADAVEMESGIIYDICTKQNISCAIIRIISDTANEDLPMNFDEITAENGKIIYSKLFLKLLKRPQLIPQLLKFQNKINQSAKNLGEFLNRLLTEITKTP